MKKIITFLLLALSVLLPFIAGYLFGIDKKLILPTLLLFLSIIAVVLREKIQSNIKGNGVSNITVGDKKPQNPQKGDLWVDTK